VIGQFWWRNPNRPEAAKARLACVEVHQERKVSHARMVKICRDLQEKWGIQYFFCDKADPGRRLDLRLAGIPAVPASQRRGSAVDIDSGIGQVYAWLGDTIEVRNEEGGRTELRAIPVFTVSPHCSALIGQMESYIRSEDGRGEPKKIPSSHHFDLMDALRYMIMGIKRLAGGQKPPRLPVRIE